MISYGSFMQTKHLCVLILIWTKGEVGAPLNRFKPSSKIFYWPFQGGASFVDHLCYFCLVLLCFHARLLMPCGHLLGKGWPLRSRLWCLIVTLSLSHWYPRSGVVLDCIYSWSLPSFLLSSKSKLKFVGSVHAKIKPGLKIPSCAKWFYFLLFMLLKTHFKTYFVIPFLIDYATVHLNADLCWYAVLRVDSRWNNN